jgi:hypothetical protein
VTENDSEFLQSLERVLKEWPEVIDVADGVLYDENAGRFPSLIEIQYNIEDRLVDSDLAHLTEVNWALFTVVHKYALAAVKIRKQDIRTEMIKFIFDKNRSETPPAMKNILVIDSSENCNYGIIQATADEFDEVFPEEGQGIEYIEDLAQRLDDDATKLLAAIWERPVRKKNAMGIHGTLFYGMEHRKKFYTSKRETDINPGYINSARRKLYENDRKAQGSTDHRP